MADPFTYFIYLSALFLGVFLVKRGFDSKTTHIGVKKANLILAGLSLLVLVLVAGLRYNTGKDYEAYAYLYEEVANLTDIEEFDMEIGYIVLVQVLNQLSLEVWSFFTISAFLTYFLFFYSFKNYKSILYLGVFFFITFGFYLYSFNGIRQAIAMSALAVAVMYAQERKIYHYFIIIILGGLMHKSMFLFLPMYFVIHRIKLSSFFWYIAFGISLVLHFIPFENIIDLDSISNLLSGTQVDYGNFASKLADNADEAGGLTLGYLVRVGIGFFILTFYSKIIKLYPGSLPYYTLALTGIIIYNSFSHLLFMTRINYYFLLFTTFSLAFILHYLYKSKQSLIANAVLMFFVLLFCYGIHLGENGASPYQFLKF
ncbi:EpsG family protein [Arenibacter troitsensis]|uniref:EpsG family protein n=1 Tax=Arenibacter troitsensis TaxID=188872 RepID=A0A1X7JI00_9FLAO|nr:EpsG family protein [Arenibacter troitsensis]SMG27338.1 EpsG family protein [Arenibacter troitsensis]